ncbi:MAG: putative glycoside hydrolase family 15 protein [Verrucomicrobiaceae bacterium]|nr:putative glycoside hydrolase family 15 protein [Verrucomicrobiaceae bacterium]
MDRLLACLVVTLFTSSSFGIDLTVSQRLAARTFPSVFQAWSPADNLKAEDELTTIARHDLVFHGPGFYDLKWNNDFEGLADGFTRGSISDAKAKRKALLARNPNLIMLAEIRYRDADRTFLPKNSSWWKRDASGKLEAGWDEGGYIQLDFANAAFRNHVALQARAVVETGAVDGVLLDWWVDDDDRLALIKAIRRAIGDDALILVNANAGTTPLTAPFINGYFMECDHSETKEDWEKIRTSLRWAEKNLRQPRINCLETWYHKSRNDLNLMRATTTLSLTHSDGMCLFSDPNPLPTGDHLHNWYDFWNRSLGKPKSPGKLEPDGTWRREFEKGLVIHNPKGNRLATLLLPEPMKSLATGRKARTHLIEECDGDIFVREP